MGRGSNSKVGRAERAQALAVAEHLARVQTENALPVAEVAQIAGAATLSVPGVAEATAGLASGEGALGTSRFAMQPGVTLASFGLDRLGLGVQELLDANAALVAQSQALAEQRVELESSLQTTQAESETLARAIEEKTAARAALVTQGEAAAAELARVDAELSGLQAKQVETLAQAAEFQDLLGIAKAELAAVEDMAADPQQVADLRAEAERLQSAVTKGRAGLEDAGTAQLQLVEIAEQHASFAGDLTALEGPVAELLQPFKIGPFASVVTGVLETLAALARQAGQVQPLAERFLGIVPNWQVTASASLAPAAGGPATAAKPTSIAESFAAALAAFDPAFETDKLDPVQIIEYIEGWLFSNLANSSGYLQDMLTAYGTYVARMQAGEPEVAATIYLIYRELQGRAESMKELEDLLASAEYTSVRDAQLVNGLATQRDLFMQRLTRYLQEPPKDSALVKSLRGELRVFLAKIGKRTDTRARDDSDIQDVVKEEIWATLKDDEKKLKAARELLEIFYSGSRSIKRADIVKLLKTMGFEVRDGRDERVVYIGTAQIRIYNDQGHGQVTTAPTTISELRRAILKEGN